MFENAKNKITNAVENTTSDFKEATKIAKKMIGKNLLFSFLSSLVLLAAALGGYLYIQNYRDGTKIAEAKAVEALAEAKKKIEQEAVAAYKSSDAYREDACKLVASNISKIDCLHYMYIYIKSDDIKKYPAVKSLYDDLLVVGHKEYKKMYRK